MRAQMIFSGRAGVEVPELEFSFRCTSTSCLSINLLNMQTTSLLNFGKTIIEPQWNILGNTVDH